jgi:3-phytase
MKKNLFTKLVIANFALILLVFYIACENQVSKNVLKPKVVTEKVKHDTDDPAIWIHPTDPEKSLIIGTDKEEDGALYVFNLDGKIDQQKTVHGLKRPNNVDVEYGLLLNGKTTDIAVTTERLESRIRIFSLPEMQPVDNGGIAVFAGDSLRAPMGVSLYKRPSDGNIYAIVGRKEGPTTGSYLWQYLLEDDGHGMLKATKVREFGIWSGKKEIEAIAVDDELGYVYYSDEDFGIRKYAADPDADQANEELAVFGKDDFSEDCEGISIYKVEGGIGYILISDQQVNKFNVYKREGEPSNPHQHRLIKVIELSTTGSDGSEVTNRILSPNFPGGLFVAMADDKSFQFYAWDDLAGKDLISAPDGKSRTHGVN